MVSLAAASLFSSSAAPVSRTAQRWRSAHAQRLYGLWEWVYFSKVKILRAFERSINEYHQVGGGDDDLLARPEQQLFGRQQVHAEYLIVKLVVIDLPTQHNCAPFRRINDRPVDHIGKIVGQCRSRSSTKRGLDLLNWSD